MGSMPVPGIAAQDFDYTQYIVRTDKKKAERDLRSDLGAFTHDPLGAVVYGFRWGFGDLANESGPRGFQRRILKEIGEHLRNPETQYKPFRKAISSGHGIGKSALIAWIVWWGLSTFEDTKVIIMAGTGDQLKTKTQPETAKWFRLALNAKWFEVNVTSIKVLEQGHESNWRADFNTWSEENPQASAGAHNKGKRLIIIYDEASGIHNEIWKTQEGALTDAGTEIIWIACSQCTKNEGYFFHAVFGTQRHRWNPECIDSREVEGVNLEEINETIAIYGEDSDHVRVRYRGLYPVVGDGSFIDQKLITEAQNRIPRSIPDDPLVAGVDFAWGGSDDNVIRFRKGFDAKSIPPIKIKGEFTRDPAVMVGKLADVLSREYNGEQIRMLFLDSAGIAAPVESRLKSLGYKNVTAINFGADSPDEHYAYMRDYMWGQMKEWLAQGAIDKDTGLASDLAKPVLISDRLQRVKLEPKDVMKKRLAKMGMEATSPDDGDALALTFAMPVAANKPKPKAPLKRLNSYKSQELGWMAH